MSRATGRRTMRTLFGAVVGALAVGAVLVSYDLGERRAFSRNFTTPTTQMQMMMGPDGIARPYLVQAGQTSFAQPAGQPYGWSPYGATAPAAAPYAYSPYPQAAYAPAQPQ